MPHHHQQQLPLDFYGHAPKLERPNDEENPDEIDIDSSELPSYRSGSRSQNGFYGLQSRHYDRGSGGSYGGFNDAGLHINFFIYFFVVVVVVFL